MAKESNAIAWESLMSNIDPLLKEGKRIIIYRIRVPDPDYKNDWCYRVQVIDKNGAIISEGNGYPLTEAMVEAYSMTPEVTE